MSYADNAATVKRLLAKFGRDVTHVKRTNGAYDVATSSSTVTETSATLKAADFALSGSVLRRSNQYQGDTTVQIGDRYALVEAGVNEITVADQFIVGGKTWSVYAVDTLAPSGVNVLFKVYLRG